MLEVIFISLSSSKSLNSALFNTSIILWSRITESLPAIFTFKKYNNLDIVDIPNPFPPFFLSSFILFLIFST